MNRKWWQEAVVYEIYCKSFCDSNGDGIGDLRGVMSKLPMLKELGVNCIWFTPIYKSPQVDNGYDVSDYDDIDPDYGTLDDFKELLSKAHSMGIRVIMDMVLNHSSDEHRWFVESRKSKDNPYRNYYIWQPPKPDGSEPNNWGNYFREGNGSAWEYDEKTDEFYLHQYAKKMPDLNWEYRPLREEIYAMLKRWRQMGVDGFRLDVFTRFKKPEGFPDTKKAPDVMLDRNGFVMDTSMCTNVKGIHEILNELHREVFGPYDCMTVGEGAGVTSENAYDYIAPCRKEIDTVYHFEMASRKGPKLTAQRFRKIEKKWAALMDRGCWPTQYFSNHDSQRHVSFLGNDKKYRKESAMLLATLIHTTPGTPFIYQGEEIGMVNVKYDSIDDYNCCYTKGNYYSLVENGTAPKKALEMSAPVSRDNARSPYQWNAQENAGFTSGKPWLKVNPSYKEINLEADRASEKSVFAYYQALINMRADCPAVIDGDLKFYMEDSDSVIAYTRSCARERLLVIANFSDEETDFTLPNELESLKFDILLTNYKGRSPIEKGLLLPWECAVYEVVG